MYFLCNIYVVFKLLHIYVFLAPKTEWECKSCLDKERSQNSLRGKSWGDLGYLDCDECKAKCEKTEECHGIQCSYVEIGHRSPVSGSTGVGSSCKWLKKPKKSHQCESNDGFQTCWIKEPNTSRFCFGYH